MKSLLIALSSAFIGAMMALSFTATANTSTPQGWQLAYEHDKDGTALAGSKDALIAAVVDGKPVRIYWAGTRVQHVIDASFLTVLQGEVFAQIPMVSGQKPSVDPAHVELRDTPWRAIFATNGDRGLKWFVQN
ncbi:hypothetical protein [Kordiimonas sp.]|uniref:hypothetical protein n=1 Tax=Kordiimonas sp. TaxID=1970157 RepID=UPI003A936CA9